MHTTIPPFSLLYTHTSPSQHFKSCYIHPPNTKSASFPLIATSVPTPRSFMPVPASLRWMSFRWMTIVPILLITVHPILVVLFPIIAFLIVLVFILFFPIVLFFIVLFLIILFLILFFLVLLFFVLLVFLMADFVSVWRSTIWAYSRTGAAGVRPMFLPLVWVSMIFTGMTYWTEVLLSATFIRCRDLVFPSLRTTTCTSAGSGYRWPVNIPDEISVIKILLLWDTGKILFKSFQHFVWEFKISCSLWWF